jgi:hypothetical protein
VRIREVLWLKIFGLPLRLGDFARGYLLFGCGSAAPCQSVVSKILAAYEFA